MDTIGLELQSAEQALQNASEALAKACNELEQYDSQGKKCPYPLLRTERVLNLVRSALQVLHDIR